MYTKTLKSLLTNDKVNFTTLNFFSLQSPVDAAEVMDDKIEIQDLNMELKRKNAIFNH